MIPPRHDRRQWLRLAGLSCALGTLGGCRWEVEGERSDPQHFRVTGTSMVPTLIADHRTTTCPNCGITIRVQLAAVVLGQDSFRCWHCGESLPTPDGPVFPGDVVKVNSGSRDGIRLGDLVALGGNSRPRVKRLFALPGMVVDIERNGQNGNRLTVQGGRLEDRPELPIPQIPVDFDSHRTISRWTPFPGSGRWRRSGTRWFHPGVADTERVGAGEWLVYRHRNVYDRDRPSPVLDDVPENVSVTRELEPVDRITVRAEARCRSTGQLEVVCWRPDGVVAHLVRVADQATVIEIPSRSLSGGRSAPFGSPPVSELAPVALRPRSGSGWQLERLRVERSIEFRLGRGHDRSVYPMTLGASECFLVGDNVPISIDSRDRGPVQLSELTGTV